jgi:APA family basic amino acid/polyamine antiporter
LSDGAGDDDRHPQDRLKRVLGLSDAVFLIVSSVVGSAIFLTPGRIADALPHPGLIFGVWLLGGLISLAGALVNAELGGMFPHAGGDYVYLRRAFHPAAGFLVGWISFFVIFVGTIATLAAGFAAGLAPYAGYGEVGTLAMAIAVTVAASALNYVGVRWGALANNLTAAVKILALAAFGVLGPVLGAGEAGNLLPLAAGAAQAAPLSALGVALSPVLFAYLGWNAVIYVGSELREPGRTLPRSLFVGLAICTAIYLAVNAVYLYALPVAELRHVDNAGEAAARALFGPVSGTLVAAFVLASILGTLNATVLVGPRIAYAMALDGLFFRGVDRAHGRFDTPHVAIVLQCAATIAVLVILERFPTSLFASALDYTTFAILLATIADTFALYALRRREPGRRRPYRAWGHPFVPALYVVACGGIVVAMLVSRPGECGVSLAMAATGLPFYVWFRLRRPVAAAPRARGSLAPGEKLE